MAATPVLDQPVRYDEPAGSRPRRRRHVLYAVSTTVLTLIVASAVIDTVGGLPLYGVDDHTARASANGTEISVNYPRVLRPQLDSPLSVSIRQAGGFHGDVKLSLSADYLRLFVGQRVTPDPKSQSADERNVISTFDAPQGDVLTVQWDMAARPRPWFTTAQAVASVLDEHDQTIVSVAFRTAVRP